METFSIGLLFRLNRHILLRIMSDFRFDNNRQGSNRDGGRPPLHDAICNECGKDCKVPFRPSGDKPVYCSECFEAKGGNERRDSRSSQRGSYDRPRFGGGRDSGRSGQGGNTGGPDFSQLTKNIEILNSKLDKIIFLLGSDEKKEVKAKAKPKKAKKAVAKTK